jgi:hypothetical protein
MGCLPEWAALQQARRRRRSTSVTTIATSGLTSGKPRPAVVRILESGTMAELDLALRSWLELP